MMNELDFEKIDQDAVRHLRKHLDPSLIKEYDDDEIYLYIMDLCDEYTEGLGDEEEVYLDLEAMATFVSTHLGQDMGVKMHEDDAYEIVSSLYEFYAEEDLVDFADTDDLPDGDA